MLRLLLIHAFAIQGASAQIRVAYRVSTEAGPAGLAPAALGLWGAAVRGNFGTNVVDFAALPASSAPPFSLRATKTARGGLVTLKLTLVQVPHALPGEEENFLTAVYVHPNQVPSGAFFVNGTGGAAPFTLAGAGAPLDPASSRVDMRRTGSGACSPVRALPDDYADAGFMVSTPGAELLYYIPRPPPGEADLYRGCHALLEGAGGLDLATLSAAEGSVHALTLSLAVAPYLADDVTVGAGNFTFAVNASALPLGTVDVEGVGVPV